MDVMWILALHGGQKGNFAQYFNQWPTYQKIFINLFMLRFVDEKSEIKIEKHPMVALKIENVKKCRL